jgi:hypothetical protein
MGYLPSFLPTEIFVTPRQEGVFGISQDSFMQFAQSTQVGGSGGVQTPSQPSSGGGGGGSGIQMGDQVGVNPNDNSGSVNPPPPSTPPTNFCPTTYFPVCANGQTFGNACEAQNAGFTQYTQGECATNGNGGGDNGNGGGNQPVFDPETGCIIQGFDNLGNPIYIDQNGNPSLTPEGCQISPDFNSGGGGDNGNGGGGDNGNGGGGTIPDDEKIIAFVKKNWMYLLAVTAGIYLLTNKSN